MKTYRKRKEEIRQEAIDWQSFNKAMYCSEIAEKTEYFENKAKRYGLVREFKENGII